MKHNILTATLGNTTFMLIVFVPLLLFFYVFYIGLNSTSKGALTIFATILLLFIPFFVMLSISGFISGWEIRGHTLNLTMSAVTTKLSVPSLEVGIINGTGWAIGSCRGGVHIPGVLLSATMSFKNGINVVALQHFSYNNFVVIHTPSCYYLIAHPEVEKLYDELLRLGATEKDFTSTFY